MSKKRNKEQRKRDLEIEREMRLEGYTQGEIAEHLNSREDVEYQLSQQTISNDFRTLEEMWKEETVVDMDSMKAREDAYLNHLYNKAMSEFRSSQEAQEQVKRKQYRNGEGGQGEGELQKEEIERKRKDVVGNPRFLEVAREVRKDIRDLWGIDSAKKVDLSGSLSHPVEVSDEDAERFEQMIQDAREKT